MVLTKVAYTWAVAAVLLVGPTIVASQIVSAVPLSLKTGVDFSQLQGYWEGNQNTPALVFADGKNGTYVQASCINSLYNSPDLSDAARLLRRVTDEYYNWESKYAMLVGKDSINDSLLLTALPYVDTTNRTNAVRSITPIYASITGYLEEYTNGTLVMEDSRSNSTITRCATVNIYTNTQARAVLAEIITALQLWVDPVTKRLAAKSACDIIDKVHEPQCKPVYDGSVPTQPLYYDPSDPANTEDDYNNYEAEYNYVQTLQNTNRPSTAAAPSGPATAAGGRKLLQAASGTPGVTRPPAFPFAGTTTVVGPNGTLLAVPAPAPARAAAPATARAPTSFSGAPAPAPAQPNKPAAAKSIGQLPFPQLVVIRTFAQCLSGQCLTLATPAPPTPVPAANIFDPAPQAGLPKAPATTPRMAPAAAPTPARGNLPF